MKKLISVILCIIIILSALPLVSGAATMNYKLFDPMLDGEKFPVEIAPGSYYGQRVKVNAPVTSVGFCMPTWSKTDSSATVGVFKWLGDCDETFKAGPIQEESFSPLRDCATNYLRLDSPLEPGEYFFAIYNTNGPVGIWRYPMTKSLGYAYKDGLEEQYDLEITLVLTETVSEPVSACSSVMDITGDMPVYEENQPSNDHMTVVRDAYADTWVVTDGLGREVTASGTSTVREDKVVGLFYWSWHNDLAGNEPFNINNFIEENPEAKNDYRHPLWPTGGTAYFWNEPVFGYYRTTDRWVLRKHAEMLAAAGIDVIFFDNTNGDYTWRSSYSVIFDVFQEAYEDGVDVPKISFMLPFGATEGSLTQLRQIYLDIYRTGEYRDMWFYWEGKPMLMAHTNNLTSSKLDKEIRQFFTFRPGQPAYDGGDGGIGNWGWLSIYPQDLYYATNKDKKRGDVEQMTVGVAQNSSPEILCTAMNGKNIRGRSYTAKDGFAHYEEKDSSLYGYNFSEQWEYALEVDPTFVFVTGWNEWTAGRQESWGSVKNAFADQFNDEYSRDIEPTKGKLKDHYYYQLIYYVRQFKGTRALPEATEKTVINMNDLSSWEGVGPYYVAYRGNTENRDAKGYGSLVYTDNSGRNDITGAKVARDNEYLYIYIECAEAITAPADNWMTVYLDTVQAGLDGWESFDYVINRTAAKDGKVSVERFTGQGFETAPVGEGEYVLSDNVLQIRVPRALLGLESDDFTLNFKVTDGVELNGDIMNFYTSGDVAPLGRFKYSYVSTTENAGTLETNADTGAVTGGGNNTSADTSGEEGGGGTVLIIVLCCVGAAALAAAIIVIRKIKK